MQRQRPGRADPRVLRTYVQCHRPNPRGQQCERRSGPRRRGEPPGAPRAPGRSRGVRTRARHRQAGGHLDLEILIAPVLG
ncbi:MAG: hypothetical protein E6K25_07935 [Gammaproteobacteria bacterium]|nr:MAG: hypothetical protein E6K25_07935 [Gammaproteobacteria bacterium]